MGNLIFTMRNLMLIWCLSFRIFSIIPLNTELDESYTIIEGRVRENLDSLMDQPGNVTKVAELFYRYKGFPHDLLPPDRDMVLKYIYSLMSTHIKDGLTLYYGLENGMSLGYWFSGNKFLPDLVYRENGTMYPTDSDNIEKELYYNECVDPSTGENTNCTMTQYDSYISCIDGCDLIICNDTNSQVEASYCSSQAFEPGSEELAYCQSSPSIKWCQNYEIEHAKGNGKEGFIPLSYYCYNRYGAITE